MSRSNKMLMRMAEEVADFFQDEPFTTMQLYSRFIDLFGPTKYYVTMKRIARAMFVSKRYEKIETRRLGYKKVVYWRRVKHDQNGR